MWPGLMNPIFSIMWIGQGVCVTYLGKRLYQDLLWKKTSQGTQCDALGNVLRGHLAFFHGDVTTYHHPKHYC